MAGLAGEPRRLRRQVVPLGKARGAAGCREIVLDRSLVIARTFEQMRAHRVEAVVACEASVGIQCIQQFQSGSRPMHHRAAIAWFSATIGLSDMRMQQAVQREDLRPVGVFRACGFVVHGRDRGLQLVAADRSLRQRGA